MLTKETRLKHLAAEKKGAQHFDRPEVGKVKTARISHQFIIQTPIDPLKK